MAERCMQAFKLYASAAKSAHVGALFNAGVCYELGEGIACDMQAAVNMSNHRLRLLPSHCGPHPFRTLMLWSKAAAAPSSTALPVERQGSSAWTSHSRVQLNRCVSSQMGKVGCHSFRVGFPVSSSVSALLCPDSRYRQAAEAGHTQAQFNLAVCFANGSGVSQARPSPSRRAFCLVCSAANSGSLIVVSHPPLCTQEPVKACAWYASAARSGHVEAMSNLGKCYLDVSALR